MLGCLSYPKGSQVTSRITEKVTMLFLHCGSLAKSPF